MKKYFFKLMVGMFFIIPLNVFASNNQYKLVETSGSAGNKFGWSVAGSEDTFIVGAPEGDADSANTGAASSTLPILTEAETEASPALATTSKL